MTRPACPEPSWIVQAVFDPDGNGKDFAYTIGLFDKGLPELHIWARPSLGDDPGHDWLLSVNDRTRVLNELGQLLVDGQLDVGTRITREYDAGLATVTFEVGPPGDRDELEAYGVSPGALVLPVRWSLRRPVEGVLSPLSHSAEERALATYGDLVADLDRTRRAPRGWRLPTMPSFDVDQRFGPLTTVVLARAAQLWQCTDDSLMHLLYMASCAQAEGCLTTWTAVAVSTARPVGRRTCLAALHEEVHGLVEHVTASPAGQRRWKAAVRGVFPDLWEELTRDERAAAHDNFARMLHHLTLDCLSVEAVADVGDTELLLGARGPWLAGLREETVLSLPGWSAAPAVLDTVRGLLAPLDWRALTAVAAVHDHQRRSSSEYSDLTLRLQTWAVTSAASCPWTPVLAELPGWERLIATIGAAGVGRLPDLEHWATCVSAALTHQQRLSVADVGVLVGPFLMGVPGLATVLNAAV